MRGCRILCQQSVSRHTCLWQCGQLQGRFIALNRLLMYQLALKIEYLKVSILRCTPCCFYEKHAIIRIGIQFDTHICRQCLKITKRRIVKSVDKTGHITMYQDSCAGRVHRHFIGKKSRGCVKRIRSYPAATLQVIDRNITIKAI